MEILRDEIVFEGKFIRTIRRFFRDRGGKEKVWEMVERKTFGDIVAIAAVTPEKELILEKSFRIPIKSWTVELPAGLMDIEGESELDTAKRELLEETGYSSDDWKLLSRGPFNSGLANDIMAIYLAKNAIKTAAPNQGDAEHIEVIKIPARNLFIDLKDMQGVTPDIKLYSLIPFLQHENLI